MDFSGATKPVPIKTIKKYLQRMQYSITTITLPKPDSIDIATLQLMVKTSGKLEELLMGRWSKFSDFDILSAVRLRPGLRILQLHGSITITEAVDIIFAIPALEVFVCHQIYGVAQHKFRYRGKVHNMKRLHLSGSREVFNGGLIIVCVVNWHF